jgi:hypothetical protein
MDKEAVMIRAVFLALAALLTSFLWSAQAAQAREAPWCAVISTTDDSVYWDCQYSTFEQCRPNVLAGNRGWCNPNPAYVPGPEPKRKSRKGSNS